MAWHCVQLTYGLLSPLHIGYHKVGNVQRTRYYIPARNLWGAVTERLTRRGFSAEGAPEGDYRQIGAWVQEHCAFSYFSVRDGQGALLFPRFTEKGVCYGELTQAEFERRYLGSHVTTALDAATTSAESGSLHEVEFIAPYDREGQGTHLRGWVFLDEQGLGLLGDGKWQEWLGELQVGGERRYGFGRLRISDNGWEEVREMGDYPTRLDSKRPQVQVAGGRPLLAHTLAQGVRARGMIEPLVGRETGKDSRSFGQALTQARVCWMPGSVADQEGWLTLDKVGIWCAYNS
ncbi:MAG: hypothetical protein C4311_02315 [Chloroflexota bacterium]